jgi:hypothetical protein
VVDLDPIAADIVNLKANRNATSSPGDGKGIRGFAAQFNIEQGTARSTNGGSAAPPGDGRDIRGFAAQLTSSKGLLDPPMADRPLRRAMATYTRLCRPI